MFPENHTVLVSGDPSSGMFEFCCYLGATYLTSSQRLVFVETDTSRTQVVHQFEAFGIDVPAHESSGSLTIVDCYGLSGARANVKGETCDISDLDQILRVVSGTLSEKDDSFVRIIFDSLTPLFLHHDEVAIGRFFRELCVRSKEHGTLTCSVHRGIIRDDQIELLTSISDGLIELRADERFKRFVRIRHMKGLQVTPRWVPFDIEFDDEPGGGTFLSWNRD